MTLTSAISLMSALGAPLPVIVVCSTVYVAYYLYSKFKR